MRLSEYSLRTLAVIVIGDNGTGVPYLSGPNINALFNDFCSTKTDYHIDWMNPESGMKCARKEFALKRLEDLNGTQGLVKLIEKVFQHSYFDLNSKVLNDEVVRRVNDILIGEGYKLESSEGRFKVVGDALPDEIKVKVHFEEIQKQILDKINNAKYLIWVAVAWFTDKELIKALGDKQEEGINVQIVVYDDEINRSFGILHHNIQKKFSIFKINEGNRSKMHNKFCVVDLHTVMHGSYNWTDAAKYNNETLDVTESRQVVESFADQFLVLKRISMKGTEN